MWRYLLVHTFLSRLWWHGTILHFNDILNSWKGKCRRRKTANFSSVIIDILEDRQKTEVSIFMDSCVSRPLTLFSPEPLIGGHWVAGKKNKSSNPSFFSYISFPFPHNYYVDFFFFCPFMSVFLASGNFPRYGGLVHQIIITCVK